MTSDELVEHVRLLEDEREILRWRIEERRVDGDASSTRVDLQPGGR